jgi:hypothetical protein
MHVVIILLSLLILILTLKKEERFTTIPNDVNYFLTCNQTCEKNKETCLKFTPTGENCNFQNAYCVQDCLWTSKFQN